MRLSELAFAVSHNRLHTVLLSYECLKLYVILLVLSSQGYTAPTLRLVIIFAGRQTNNWDRARFILFYGGDEPNSAKTFADFNWTSLYSVKGNQQVPKSVTTLS